MQRVSALSGLGLTAGIGAAATVEIEGKTAAMQPEWRMPDESYRHTCAFIAFAAQNAVWDTWTSDVQDCLGQIARTIAAFEPLKVLCRSSELDLARRICGTKNTHFITLPLDDIWVRDTGPSFVISASARLAAVDFNFNGWGGKQMHVKDADVAKKISADTGANRIKSKLTGEGGAIEVDGHGTGIMTESSWINKNRNPGWTKIEVENELKAMLGLRKIIWLPGIKGKDITDAHVDFYARFVSPGTIIANLDNDPASYDYQVTREHLKILENATDADGRRLKVHTLPPPRDLRQNKFTVDNADFAPGYINYFVINGAVIAPQFGDRTADENCRTLLSQLYPGRKVVQLDIDPIAAGGGGIHCVTLHQPQP